MTAYSEVDLGFRFVTNFTSALNRQASRAQMALVSV
jgi:hypothetical protein